jgi:hypothetical protein
MHMKRVLATARALFILFVFACLAMALPVGASLGSDYASVEADRAKMQGTLQTNSGDTFTVHQIQGATGVAVKEYASPDGKVFAVTWQGPFHPDLHQVLGNYYGEYMKAAQAQRANRHGHGPLLIQEQGLVVQISGHLRSFYGRAYLPEMLPANVHIEDIK